MVQAHRSGAYATFVLAKFGRYLSSNLRTFVHIDEVQVNKYDIGFFQKLAHDKGGRCISNTYKNCRTKLEFECLCGHVWAAEPRHIVAGRWCPRCGHQSGRKYQIDHDFFSWDTEESFYVAGFWAADGWKTKVSGGFGIGLQLCDKDYEHLQKIRSLLGCSSPCRFRKRETRINGNKNISVTKSFSFLFNSEQCYKDLERFGVTERKTYTLRFPEWLKTHPLLHHYMRGYIDGDGCFLLSYPKNRTPDVRFCMRGTKEFLESFHEVLVMNGVMDKPKEIIANAGKKAIVFGLLGYNGNVLISKMYDFLYKDASIFLARKEEIAKQAKTLSISGGRKRKMIGSAFNITKEMLLERAHELKSGRKIAKFFGCTPANISWWVRRLDIKEEYLKAVGKLDHDEIYRLYEEKTSCAEISKRLGVTRTRIYQILKEYR